VFQEPQGVDMAEVIDVGSVIGGKTSDVALILEGLKDSQHGGRGIIHSFGDTVAGCRTEENPGSTVFNSRKTVEIVVRAFYLDFFSELSAVQSDVRGEIMKVRIKKTFQNSSFFFVFVWEPQLH